MDRFIDYILTEMSADDFAAALAKTDVHPDEQIRLIELAQYREAELISLHVFYPNEY